MSEDQKLGATAGSSPSRGFKGGDCKAGDPFYGLAEEAHTRRKLLTFKDDSVGASGAQAGVYLDSINALMTIETDTCFWVFWMARINQDSGGAKGHAAAGRKKPEEGRVMSALRADLRRGGLGERQIFSASSLEEAHRTFLEKWKVSPASADAILNYLQKLI